MGLVAMTVITAGFAFSHHHGPAPTPAATFTAQGETQTAHDVERVADDLDAWRTADPADPVAGGFAVERATSDLEGLPPC